MDHRRPAGTRTDVVQAPALRTSVLLGVLLASTAGAQSFGRLRGGGPARTDCMLVTDVAGIVSGPRAAAAACTDGDPACDADGTANGTCVFTVRLCLDDGAEPACRPEVVTHAALTTASPVLDGLSAALAAVRMPVSTETCTANDAVAVPTKGRHAGRLVMRATATMASGHADRDRVALRCRPAPGAGPPASFATIQRTVFARSCSTLSCHGASGAGGLTLAGDAAYRNLVGVPATNPAAHDAGLLRVVPGDPDSSFLMQKLRGALTAGEGTPMPQVGFPLSAARVELVRRWIAAGAPATGLF
jgi:hypothetical protein